jgi:hypothetical protein
MAKSNFMTAANNNFAGKQSKNASFDMNTEMTTEKERERQ